MALQEPKTNWNSDDYFNAEDLNRVENNTLEVYRLSKMLRGEFFLEDITTGHNMTTIPFDDLLNKVEGNIKRLGEEIYRPSDWNDLEADWKYNTPFSYQDLNKWERNILFLYNYAKGNVDSIPHCGMFAVGEEVI